MYKRIKCNFVSEFKGIKTWNCQTQGCKAKLLTKSNAFLNRITEHRKVTHRPWTDKHIVKHQLQQQIVDQVCSTNQPPHQACKSVARDNPTAVTALSGWKDCRNKAYRAKQKAGFTLPRSKEDIGSALIKCGYDSN